MRPGQRPEWSQATPKGRRALQRLQRPLSDSERAALHVALTTKLGRAQNQLALVRELPPGRTREALVRKYEGLIKQLELCLEQI